MDSNQTQRRKQDQSFLVARLTRALLKGQCREAHLILKGSPELSGLTPSLAALCGDAEGLRSHLASDPTAHLHADEITGMEPLFAAALSRAHLLSRPRGEGQAECLLMLLAAGASAQSWRSTGSGPMAQRESLLAAAIRGSRSQLLVQLLLDHGADPQEADALVTAVRLPEGPLLEMLLDRGAHPQGSAALLAALEQENPARVALLLGSGADVNDSSSEDRAPLVTAILEERSVEVLRLLIAAGADPNSRQACGLTAYQQAVRQGLSAQADILVAAGADPYIELVDCLFGFCSRGMTDMALNVLSANPDLFDRACDRDEHLMIEAVRLDKRIGIRSMLEVGFSVQACKEGQQPLHVAAHYGRSELIQPLIDAEAPLRARNLDDRTPLAIAVRASSEPPTGGGNYLATVKALLEAGAWPESWMIQAADDEIAQLIELHLTR